MKWTNWAKTVTRESDVVAPRSLAELQVLRARVRSDRGTLRPFGARHSFSAVAAPAGVALDLLHFDTIEIDGDLVRVGAGVRLHRLNAVLAQAGRALTNLGDIDRQSIAGAVSTGTHGTGLTYGSISSTVTALELLLPSGDLIEVSTEHEPDIFAAARLGLGLFGIITAVTLRTVPLFYLDAHERPVLLTELMGDLPGFLSGADHAEFYLFPGTTIALAKENRRTTEPGARSAISRLWSEEVVENGMLQAVSSLGGALPALVRPLNRLASHTTGERSYRDSSAGVFTSPRRVRFKEMEYALPFEALQETLTEITGYLDAHKLRLSFPLEIRTSAAEDAWLAPAHGRTTAWIAVQQYHRLPFVGFSAIESILLNAGGRPHWAKMHTRQAKDLASLYPCYEQATELQRSLDPHGMLLTPYLAELFS